MSVIRSFLKPYVTEAILSCEVATKLELEKEVAKILAREGKAFSNWRYEYRWTLDELKKDGVIEINKNVSPARWVLKDKPNLFDLVA